MQKIILLFPIFFSYSLYAQNGPIDPLSSRSNGVANASVAFTGINSLFNNQAGLTNLENISFLFSGQETFDGALSEYSDNFGGGFAIPVSLGAIGLSVHYFGAADIKQTKIGFTYARKLLEALSIGVQFDMINTRIPLNDKSNLLTFEIGLQYELNEKFLLGVHLYNPSKLEIIEDEYLPTILRVGTTYSPYENLLIHAELEKDFDFSLVFKSGVEYELLNKLWLRIGYQNKPKTYNIGTGFLIWERLRVDLAAFYQKGLNLTSSGVFGSSGIIPSFGFGYDLFKK